MIYKCLFISCMYKRSHPLALQLKTRSAQITDNMIKQAGPELCQAQHSLSLDLDTN